MERKKKWDEKQREFVTDAHRELSAFDLVSYCKFVALVFNFFFLIEI